MVITALVVAGCGGSSSDKKPSGAEGTGAPGRADSGGMNMGGMPMGTEGMNMMGMMRTHMDSMQHMSPGQMQAMMARHQDMASRMMDAMGADMRGMHMSPDAGWTALSDSVRQDLAELAGLSGKELEARVRGHVDRMQRLMARHESMMKR
jgi:hypothetical protein